MSLPQFAHGSWTGAVRARAGLVLSPTDNLKALSIVRGISKQHDRPRIRAMPDTTRTHREFLKEGNEVGTVRVG